NNYHNNNYHNNDYDESNNIDAYVGIGLGIKFGHIQIETFARLREIDSTNWEAENHIYTGIQTSLSF
ncbi:MAG: hypothetical protein HRT38_20080, partial [Alteromonadaceae bacterium]|nr:hypothetical protein [Alteromonadaceae bacterium]